MTLSLTHADRLARLPIFRGLGARALARLSECARHDVWRDGQIVFRQGDLVEYTTLLIEGWAKLARVTVLGHEIVIRVARGVEWLSEPYTQPDAIHPVSATAVGEIETLRLPLAALTRILGETPDLAFAFLGAAQERAGAFIEEIESLKGETADQRLLRFILSLCESGVESCTVRLPFDKRLLAARLGVKQETLSRAFGRLRALGVTSQGAREVTIASVSRLLADLQCDPGELGALQRSL